MDLNKGGELVIVKLGLVGLEIAGYDFWRCARQGALTALTSFGEEEDAGGLCVPYPIGSYR